MYKTISEFFKQSKVEENLEVHDSLNPNIWDSNNILLPEVKKKILSIVDTFNKILKDDDLPLDIIDIQITGSNANYTYTDKSDLDIHIMVNMKDDCSENHLQKIYNAYKTLFNLKHDILINDIPVEVYVEDILNSSRKTNGVYSVINNIWLEEPNAENIPKLDSEKLNKNIDKWKKRYFQLVNKIENNNQDPQLSLNEIDKYLDDIYDMRQKGLKKEGEYSIENQTFKEIRNDYILQDLKDLKIELTNKVLSL